MRILVYGINTSPDLTGIGKYTGEMNEYLAGQGHKVTMLTAHPYYPEWELHPDYPRFFWKKEYVNGVKVFRCPLYIPHHPTALRKIIHEFSFIMSSMPIWTGLMVSKKYDYVLVINPPFHLTAYTLVYKWIKGAKLISHVQDLQVDVVKDMELIRNKFFLKLMFKVEKFLFDKSDWVSTISQGMEKKIANKGVPKSKQLIFPNWVDCDFIRPLSKEESLRKEFGLSITDKVVLYSGNLGEKQGLEMILDLALAFEVDKRVKFVIVGSGGAKKRLESLAIEMGLDNTFFFPLQAYEDLPRLLAVADVHLVLQKKEASDLVMPSKLTGIFSAGGLALITAGPGTTLFEVVEKHKMGILVNPGEPAELYEGLVKALNDDSTQIYKSNAREYAVSNLGKESVLSGFEHFLENHA